MAQHIPITLLAAALLLPTVTPAGAVESTVEGSLGYYSLRDQGHQEKAREYDGRNLSTREHREADKLEADVSVFTAWEKTLLEIEGKNLSSGNDSGYLDYTYGDTLRLKGSIRTMLHRMRDTQMGMVFGGHYYTMEESAAKITGAAYNANNLEHQEVMMNRDVTDVKLILRDAKCPVWMTVGLWNEREYGMRMGAYYNHNRYAQPTNRFRRDLTGAVETSIGENGYLGYEVVASRFEEHANSLRTASTRNYGILSPDVGTFNPNEIVSDHGMMANTVSGNFRVAQNLNVAFGATRRTREHYTNKYERHTHSAHLGATYKPSKDWSFNGRFYGKVQQTDETLAQFNPTNTQSVAEASWKKDAVDRYNYKADLKARYAGFKNWILSFGYKPEHTFRRNGGTWTERATFSGVAHFHDGYNWRPYESINPTETKDTKHTFNAKAVWMLPGNAQASLAATEMYANRGGYQYQPTHVSNQTLEFSVPLGNNVYASLIGGTQYDSNRSNSFKRFKRRKNWGMIGGSWMADDGKGSVAMHYGLEKGRDWMQAHIGDADSTTAGRVPPAHIAAPVLTTNHTFSGNAMAALSEKTKLDVNAAYAMVKGDFTTNGAFLPVSRITEGQELTNIEPVDTRTFNWGVGVNYAVKQDLSARIAFEQSWWYDHLLRTDNGQSQLYSASLSAKF